MGDQVAVGLETTRGVLYRKGGEVRTWGAKVHNADLGGLWRWEPRVGFN